MIHQSIKAGFLLLTLLFGSFAQASVGSQLTPGEYALESGDLKFCRPFTASRVGNAVRAVNEEYSLRDHTKRALSDLPGEEGCAYVETSQAFEEGDSTVIRRENLLECPNGIRRRDIFTLTIEHNKITVVMDTPGASRDVCVFRRY